MLLWMISYFPFKDKLICCSHIISEIGFVLFTSSLFFFLSETMVTSSRSNLGSITIWGLITLIVIIWIIFVVHMVKVFILKRRFKKQQKLAKKLEEEAKITAEKARVYEEKMKLCQQRHRKVLEMISEENKEIKVIYIYIYINLGTVYYGTSPVFK